MNSSFYTGVAGMKAHQYGIDILSDNIANVNTVGYKSTAAEFSTIYSQQIVEAGSFTDPTVNDIGVGSTQKGVSTNFSGGALIDSGNKYDMAIEGEGWFGVLDKNNQAIYTRAGQFARDADGFLVDASGNHVLGTSANNVVDDLVIKDPSDSIKLSDVSTQAPIHIPDTLKIPSVPTTYVNFKGPLDPRIIEEVGPGGKKVEVPNKEVYRTDIYDSKGNANRLEVHFTKVVPQQSTSTTWNAEAILKDIHGNIISNKTGKLEFNGKGALISNDLTTIDNNGEVVDLEFGTPYSPNTPNSGYDGLVSLTGVDASRNIVKDGNPPGNLTDYGVDALGNIQANFSNGKTIPISKVAIYHFKNEPGLEKVGNSGYRPTANSGDPKFFKDANGETLQVSNIKNQKLEVSNLNMTSALTDLIILQKAFDASAKSITTSDQLIQNAINMKR